MLWFFYNYRVNQAITTVEIPYAIQKIDSGGVIQEENIEYREISISTLDDNDIVTDVSQLIGKYVCVGSSVPTNGFFYQTQICNKLPNSVLDELPEGYYLYALSVNSELTYGNSIRPNSYIDLWMRAITENGQILYGPLVQSIKVLEVRDANNLDISWNSEAGEPAYLLFAVDEELHTVLELSKDVGASIEPVPRTASYTANPGDTILNKDELYSYIMRFHAS